MIIDESKPLPLPYSKESLFNYFLQVFKPVKYPHQANYFMSSKCIYEKMRELYRGIDYNYADVELFLHQSGYKLENMGNSDTDHRWLIKT